MLLNSVMVPPDLLLVVACNVRTALSPHGCTHLGCISRKQRTTATTRPKNSDLTARHLIPKGTDRAGKRLPPAAAAVGCCRSASNTGTLTMQCNSASACDWPDWSGRQSGVHRGPAGEQQHVALLVLSSRPSSRPGRVA